MRDDQIIALNALMFAERWRLQPWLDIRWDGESQKYSTFIIHSVGDAVEDEAEYEISSLSKLNILLATDEEFYRNVTTLVSIGALEPHDVKVEALVGVIVDRITGTSPKSPYPYSMVTGEFSTVLDHIYRFDGLEEETGLLALEAIKLLSRTGDWWGEVLEVRHVDKEWSDEDHDYVPSKVKFFTTHVVVEDMYRFSCRETVKLTADNIPLLAEAVEDVIFHVGSFSEAGGFSLSALVAVLFCEGSGEVNDELSHSRVRALPEDFVPLLLPVESIY